MTVPGQPSVTGPGQPSRAVLSIGSNLGDRLAHLQSAVDSFGPAVRAVSAVHETAPWGPVPQPDYLNAVLLVELPGLTPRDWLDRAFAAENAAARVRDVRFGPRTLDVDVITVDAVESADPDLTLPHPRAAQRAFVLVPWAEVDPAAELVGHGRVARLLTALDPADRAGVRRRADLVLTLPAGDEGRG